MEPQLFYAIYKGRVDKPAIYCSWSQVHPRVIGYEDADHEKFTTLEAARKEMLTRGILDFDLCIENFVKEKSTSKRKGRYYAVAGGKITDIFPDWGSASKAIVGTQACHQSFRSKEEAEYFIASWQEAFADVSRRAVMKGLEIGWKPRDMKFDVSSLLTEDDESNIKREYVDTKVSGIEKEDHFVLPEMKGLAIKEDHEL